MHEREEQLHNTQNVEEDKPHMSLAEALRTKENINDTSSCFEVQEKHEFNVLKEKVVEHEQPKTPIEVLPSNPIFCSNAQIDLEVLKEVFYARNAREDVDHIGSTPYMSKSHHKKMKPNKYNT